MTHSAPRAVTLFALFTDGFSAGGLVMVAAMGVMQDKFNLQPLDGGWWVHGLFLLVAVFFFRAAIRRIHSMRESHHG